MPELPDVTIYVEALDKRVTGRVLERIRLASPFLLRSVEPPPRAVEGRRVTGVRRLGKRIVLALEAELFLVVHLMIAGRLRWKPEPQPTRRSSNGSADGRRSTTPARTPSGRSGVPPLTGAGRSPAAGRGGAPAVKIPGKLGLAAFDFDSGTLLLTEAGSKKRASLHIVRGETALGSLGRGGLEILGAAPAEFRRVLVSENHTLKRALTDPRLFSGIGNAYSDEILHRAGLSPLALTRRIDEEEISRLHDAVLRTLLEWTERLRRETGDGFPEKVTAFREGMAVHGRFGKPCPLCGTKVQRIVYAENECNYCPRCQTGGRLLADRALSRLLHADWPRTIEELESGLATRQAPDGPPPGDPRRSS